VAAVTIAYSEVAGFQYQHVETRGPIVIP
jgi:hypothetical protein